MDFSPSQIPPVAVFLVHSVRAVLQQICNALTLASAVASLPSWGSGHFVFLNSDIPPDFF